MKLQNSLFPKEGYLNLDVGWAVRGSPLTVAFHCNDLYDAAYIGWDINIYRIVHGNTIGAYNFKGDFSMPLAICMSEIL